MIRRNSAYNAESSYNLADSDTSELLPSLMVQFLELTVPWHLSINN
jgi:hypothetical protein